MNVETIELVNLVAPALAAAIGSIVATKVSVARLREDVKVLFKKVDQLGTELKNATIEQEREHGEVKAEIATIKAHIDNMRSPWARQTQTP